MITFTRPLDTGKLRMAYNNDVAEFYSTSENTPAYCDVLFQGQEFSLRLYPAPTGKFFINFKDYVSACINTRNFEDVLHTNLQTPHPQSFIYDATPGTLLITDVGFKIWFSETEYEEQSFTMKWLAGAEQLSDYNYFAVNGTYLLTPFKKYTANHYYLKYWQGYPFDVPVYSNNNSLTIKNNTNALSQTFVLPGNVSRIYLSDGRTDESLEDLLPLVEGYNKLSVINSGEEGENDKFLLLEKIPYQCGIYLKWLNRYGCYNYWLFENTYTIDRSAKQLGELSRDNANLEDTFSRAIQIGKESQDTMKIIAELLTEEETNVLQGILDSPKVYMFTGKPFAQSSYRDWIEVSLKSGNARIKNAKQPLNNFSFDIELPARYTQTL
jgi:hypothetical protein